MAANNPRIALTFAAALALVPVAAHATMSRAVEFDEKVDNSAAIVVGKVVAQQSRMDEANHRILTYSTFRIEKTLKGMPAQEITVVTPGGTIGNIAQDFVGVPRFRQGDEHVVFVRNSTAGPTVAYLEQGAYRVVKDERGERMTDPLVSTAVLVDTQRGVAVAPEHPRTLRAFEQEVRDAMGRREVLRMKVLEEQKRQASIWGQLQRNKLLVSLALLGAIIATWQYLKRS